MVRRLAGTLVGVVVLVGCNGAASPPCGGACTASEICVEVGAVGCAPKCSQDAGTAETDAGVCAAGTTCQEAVTEYCDQPCQVSTADVCL